MAETLDKDKFLREMRANKKKAVEAERENRDKAIDDLNFVHNDQQWPNELKQARSAEGRPCLTINRLPVFIDQVVGDQRQNRPQIKVRPLSNDADPQIADIMDGMIRNIEYHSQAASTYDMAFEQAVTMGIGYLRVETDYINDNSFDQEILIKPIQNPFAVYLDPAALNPDRSDAKWGFVTETISREEFEKRFPDAMPPMEPEAGRGEEFEGWFEKDKVKIAEYWVKESKKKTIYLLSDGHVVSKDEADKIVKAITIAPPSEGGALSGAPLSPPISIVKDREVTEWKVKQYLVSGNEILEGPKDWAGKYIPIVPVIGKEFNVQGKKVQRGLIRWAKDSQRMYNYWKTLITEIVTLAPKAPYMVTPEQIEGHEAMWRDANIKSFPYLLYNATNTGAPQRNFPSPPPAAMFTEAQAAVDDMKGTTGLYDAKLGNQGNETSGKAIIARQKQGDTVTYAFVDNLHRAIAFTGRIIVDLIPKIYDTERDIKIRLEDDTEQNAVINKAGKDEQGQPVIINDLNVGKYGVHVDAGPDFATKRLESIEGLMEFARVVPKTADIAPDLLAKNLDIHEGAELEERFRKILPPGLVEPKEGEKPMQPMQPNPMMMAKLESEQAKAMKDKSIAAKNMVEAQGGQEAFMTAMRVMMNEEMLKVLSKIPAYPEREGLQ